MDNMGGCFIWESLLLTSEFAAPHIYDNDIFFRRFSFPLNVHERFWIRVRIHRGNNPQGYK